MELLYKDRSQVEQEFIREVCSYITSESIDKKEESNYFAAIFVEGRNRPINTLEDFTSIYSFKRFSKYNYPIFVFCHTNKDWMNGDYATLDRVNFIQIPELNSLEFYTEFCTKQLYYLLPDWVENILTIQPDGMLLKNRWEDYCINSGCDWLSSHWKHLAHIEMLYDDEKWGKICYPSTIIGNGGFSFRKVSKMKQISNNFSKCILREYGRTDNRVPMEDLFYCYNGFGSGIMKKPTLKQCDEFSVDPLTLDIWNNKEKWPLGFHYFRTESQFPPCNHD